MSKILRFGALLCVLFFTGNAFAAGYSCPTYKKYTSCSAGYYMTSSSSSTACNTTAVAGNACRPCSAYGSNYTCAGGTACPKASTITVSCSAGKYIASGSTSCSATCPANSWCAGGSFTIPASGASGNTGIHGTCSGTYPYSDAGSSSQNNCYKNNTKSGSQVAPSLPTGCGAQTTNACTPGTCTYRTYYNGSTTNCTPSNCTQTHKTCTSANSNYYLASGVAKTCSSANSSYPTSDGGNITSSSCYGSFSKSGNQLDPSMPTGCAARTLSACTPGTCTFTRYASGTIKSDCTPSNCTKGQTCTSASANYYLDSGAAKTCSSYSSTYTQSDGGNISNAYCYISRTKTGSQLNGSTPSNCYSVTAWNACTPGTCTYKDYASATDTTCTPSNCTKTVKSVSANANYYVSGTSCAACSGLASGFYPNSSAGNTGGASVCKTNSLAGKYVASANASSATNCGAGKYKASHQVAYGSTSSCNTASAGYYAPGTTSSSQTQCVAGSYSTAGASACTACGAGKTSSAGATSASACTSCSAITNINSWASSSWNSNNTMSNLCTVSTCNGSSYKSGNSCPSCPSGYTANTSTGKTSISQCQISVEAGKYVGTANSASLSSCAAGTAKAAHSVNYGSTSSCSACTGATYSGAGAGSCSSCPSGYTANTASNKTAASQCQISVSAGKYVGTANSASLSSCAAGTAKAAHNVNYGSTSSCSACTGATYSGAGAGSCSSCPSGYTANTTSNKTAASQCQISVAGGKYIATANESAASGTCAAGTYKGAHTVNYGSTSSCSVCAANNYSDAGAGACTACATANGYTNTGTTAAAHAGIASCKATCSGAQYVATAGAGCVSVGAGYWGAGGTVAQNATLARTQCPDGYRDGGAVSVQTSCAMNVPAKYYLKTANDSAPTICAGGTWNPAHTKTYGQTSTCNACPTGYTSGAAASAQSACQMSVAAGKHVATANDSTATNCAANTYRTAHAVNYGATSTCTSCPSGYSVALGAGTAKNSCKITCSAGKQVATADAACTTPAGSWYAAAHTVAAGSVSGSNVKACLTNYATANTTTATDHDAASDCKISCGAGTRIAAANATSCTTPAGNWYVGAHTVSQGSASSVNNCLANYTISGTAATNHDAENDCKITCGGGTYIAVARNTSCSNVGSGYWATAATVSQGNAGTRNACTAGLTTIGFGTGADEEDDCGRVLNIGADKIYLRSAKKTSPSLNVGINGTTYYGNMGTAAKGTLRIQSGSTTYSVYDDSI